MARPTTDCDRRNRFDTRKQTDGVNACDTRRARADACQQTIGVDAKHEGGSCVDTEIERRARIDA